MSRSLLPGARKFVPTGANDTPLPNYVPGLGRGATAFTTRAETAPAPVASSAKLREIRDAASRAESQKRAAELFGKPPPGYIPGRGRGATGFAGGVSRDDSIDYTQGAADKSDLSDANFDPFTGYAENLFNDGEYDEEDRVADEVYESIDHRMDGRRRSRREARLKEEIAKMRAEKPTIHQQFADLKKGLATVTQEEWESIPDIGDYTLKRKQKKQQILTPASDRGILEARNRESFSNSIASAGTATPIGFGMATPLMGGGLSTPLGLQTPLGIQTPLGLRTPMGSSTPSLNDLGEARGTVLSVKLDKVMDSISGQTVIDPKGYLTDLNSMQLQSDADIADIKKARTLLKSVTSTNPNHAPGWIAAARLEELAGKLQSARELISLGCQRCPKSEDVWLEAARLEKPRNAKAVLAKAVSVLPHSVRLWLDAYNREKDITDKRLVLRKALEFIPNSARLWKEACSLEDERNARILLTRAVECVPQSHEMWLALARLSTYEEAQKVLNEARKKCPTSPEIWVAACKLEETQGNEKMVQVIIGRAVDNLIGRGVAQTRDVWLKLAEEAEASGFLKTAQAIIRATMKVGVENINAKRVWSEDAEECLSRGSITVARALYTHALERLRTKKSLWLALADLETKHGTREALEKVLQKAVTCCPKADVLWLMAAKQQWLKGDINAARRILAEAFSHNENSEAISLAAVKLERENNEFERARKLLKRTRQNINTANVWMQSIQLERQLGDYDAAIALADEAVKQHQTFAKLWMVRGQLHEEHPTQRDLARAIDVFREGTVCCPRSVPLWLCWVNCERSQKNWNRARAVLEKAKLRVPNSPELWLALVQIEIESGNREVAQHVAAKAIQACPNAGIIWAEAIFLEEENAQTHRAVDALTKCENDVNVIHAVARLFWRDKKIAKARKWMNRSVTLDPSLGDAWASYLAFELENGGEKECIDIINRCALAQPNRGLAWNKTTKQVRCWSLSLPQKLCAVLEYMYPDALKKEGISKDLNSSIPVTCIYYVAVVLDALHGKLQDDQQSVGPTDPATSVVPRPVSSSKPTSGRSGQSDKSDNATKDQPAHSTSQAHGSSEAHGRGKPEVDPPPAKRPRSSAAEESGGSTRQ
ncbi:LOW QUALITY PROTEIN: U5 snRNP-associated 102 kDa protein, putative [Eimeria necatrix]|uniref:U5 snRNP-associated 102 kDa protein, putative n=1 Tax=Eimeria necatrix TaxID=51315 RepID=U6MGG6_9EIME|nr:LOW QUALITY PROTEIN: U5 snRNP-associated 102 kDa protein, putative [Eimeria necatrix]CDJ63352.1 U5 snRNP-associated 102 kDa protein, putative [Eimeria necatrix]